MTIPNYDPRTDVDEMPGPGYDAQTRPTTEPQELEAWYADKPWYQHAPTVVVVITIGILVAVALGVIIGLLTTIT